MCPKLLVLSDIEQPDVLQNNTDYGPWWEIDYTSSNNRVRVSSVHDALIKRELAGQKAALLELTLRMIKNLSKMCPWKSRKVYSIITQSCFAFPLLMQFYC